MTKTPYYIIKNNTANQLNTSTVRRTQYSVLKNEIEWYGWE